MSQVLGRLGNRAFGGKSAASAASLLRWNRAAGIFFGLQGIAILLFSASVPKPLYASFLTHDTLQSQLTHRTVTALAIRQLTTINISYLVAAWLLVAAGISILAATFYRRAYDTGLKKGISLFRWVEAGAGSALLAITIGLLAGMYDVALLAATLVLAGSAAAAGFAYEYAGTIGKRARMIQCLLGWTGLVLGLMPWLIIAIYALNAVVFGAASVLPAYWFWLGGLTLVLMGSWSANIYMGQIRRGRWANYLYSEQISILIGVTLKTAAAWLVFAVLLRP